MTATIYFPQFGSTVTNQLYVMVKSLTTKLSLDVKKSVDEPFNCPHKLKKNPSPSEKVALTN